MDADGSVHERVDRALPPVGHPLADLPAPRQFRAAAARASSPVARAEIARSSTPRARRAAARSVRGELRSLLRSGQIDAEQQRDYRAIYDTALKVRKRLSSDRGAALQGVINNTNFMAGRGDLTASRLPAIFTTLRRNTEWWQTGRLLSYGERVEFNDSELVWQYYPGEGIQLQVLGTFGKANGLWMAKDKARLANVLDEMSALASTRGGAYAWEYYFYFGGGRPPWASAMAQATGVQAFARAAQLLRKPAYLATAKRAIKLFELGATTGVGVKTSTGRRYLLYSFAPSQQVLNAFVQTLVGLNDYWEISRDARARKLFVAGEKQARLDLAATDTGAWSLYQVGGSESDLSYQELVTGFIHNLCDRAEISFWCRADERFRTYLEEPPALELTTRRVSAGKTTLVRFEVSKMSKVGLTIKRSGSTSLATSATVARGSHGYTWRVPSAPGSYDVVLTGTDLAGNYGRATATITVVGKART